VRKTLLGFAAIALIGAIIVFVIPSLISTDALREKLLAQVEASTGYRLRVNGPVKVSLFPSLDLVAEDVGLAQSGAGAGSEMATAKTLRFSLTLGELLSGKVKLREVTLIDPVIALPQKQAKTGAEVSAKSKEYASGNSLQNFSLDKLVIENGIVMLPASDGSQGKRIKALNLEASLPSYSGPLTIDIRAVFEDKPFHVAGTIGSFGHFLEGAAAPISTAIDAPAFSQDTIALTGATIYRGDTFTLSQFFAKASDKSVAGNATYKSNVLTLNPLTARSGGNEFSGAAMLNLAGPVPYLVVNLTGKALDLDAFMEKTHSATPSAGLGWSDAGIDFAPLRSLNAKLQLSFGHLVFQNIKVDSVEITTSLVNGKLTAQLPNFKLYNGSGTATVAIDAGAKIPTQVIKLSLASLDAYSFLKDSAGFQSIEGTTAIALDLNASGSSQSAIVAALNGTAKVEFTDGAIRGINIAKMVRSLTTGIVSGWQENAAEKTDFATLAASFLIAKGQAETQDLQLAGPLVRMTGAGRIDVPAQTLKLRVDPQMVASLEGQGRKTDLEGLGVPVIIAGPWAKPSIYPDVEGILQNPAAAYQQLNKLGGGLISLPNNITDKLGGTGGVAGSLLQNGKIDKSALQQDAIKGLGQLLGSQPPPKTPFADPGPADQEPQQTKPEQKSVADPASVEVKIGKKRSPPRTNSPSDRALTPGAAAKVLDFLGN
jgi:AsmA protein